MASSSVPRGVSFCKTELLLVITQQSLIFIFENNQRLILSFAYIIRQNWINPVMMPSLILCEDVLAEK